MTGVAVISLMLLRFYSVEKIKSGVSRVLGKLSLSGETLRSLNTPGQYTVACPGRDEAALSNSIQSIRALERSYPW
jgi:hypothetical protein